MHLSNSIKQLWRIEDGLSALKRMIAYISSNTAGCRYCQAHAIRAAERYGAEKDKLENIWNYKKHPSFTEPERAALDFAFAGSTVPNSVNDRIAENLRRYWDEGEITEKGQRPWALSLFLFSYFDVCQFFIELDYSSVVIFGLAVNF